MTFNTLSFRNLPIVHHKKVQPNTNMQFQDKLPADQNHLQTKILYCNHTTMSTSAARNSPYKLQGLVTLLFRYKISPSAAAGGGPVTSGLSNAHQISHRRDFFSTNFFGYGRNVLSQQQSRSFSGSPKEADGKSQVKDEERKIQSTSPVSDKQSFSTWAKWLLGSFLTLLPFLKQKWERLKGIEGAYVSVLRILYETKFMEFTVTNGSNFLKRKKKWMQLIINNVQGRWKRWLKKQKLWRRWQRMWPRWRKM
ncbi:OLC1v1002702C1 [Oldenlandia corymbosa var. corymbosa]|uniref:OLC1v1002702C1 n=1 Tax=Oldenlandia corymbosa var. corymbosa TaxID=529605 RepID=A0AAV1D8H3_OLDCO|nr:OLC1v1002702C1 [Oldenlandia corymbosa var. corymbosa]